MFQTPPYSIELLAPARDAAVAMAAISHGADAVYIGASSHGARAAASNSVADIATVCDFAHRFGARVYVTLNTLVYDNELIKVEHLVNELYRAGTDALIVQDMALLRLDIPPIALHASTQCDIRTPAKARFLQELGFSQLVLPREMTLSEIKDVRNAVSVPLEAFVHGALCVSYSGDCRGSLLCGGRSANRGECAQICRLPYNLETADGRELIRGRHLLSLRDLNRLDSLADIINAGVSSLKIEGRLKDEAYVKNIVSAYDMELRRLGVSRTSDGEIERTFTPDVNASFNRGFTRHFLYSPMPAKGSQASFDSPKSIGREVATVAAVNGRQITLSGLRQPLANGDGLNFNVGGSTFGFRVNRFEHPATVFVTAPVKNLKPGAVLRRNFNKPFADLLADPSSATRYIPVQLTLRRSGSMLVLESDDSTAATVSLPEVQIAKTPQTDARKRVMAKLGNTVYRLESLTDLLGNEFVPSSLLATLRRNLVAMLDTSRACRFAVSTRHHENADALWPEGESLTFHANVANRLAEQVYRDHGVSGSIEPALEVKRPAEGEVEVMTTRYCLRRELGACLKTPAGKSLPDNLLLRAPGKPPMKLAFDCNRCIMHISINLNQ